MGGKEIQNEQLEDLGVKKRIKLLNQVYEEFEKRKEEFSRLITREMGKPTKESISEVTSALKKFKWFLDHGEKALKDEITFKGKDSIHKIVYEPFGAAAVIAPWNYPLGMLIWGIVPNLIVGNTVVCKTSEECPLTGKLVEEIMDSKSIPRGVFSEVYGAGNVGQKLAESDVNLIWFTGSTKVGKLLYKIAAEKFIKGIFEMGGSNPCIVLKDVEVSSIIPTIYTERFQNCGQSCDALKRLLVHESIFGEVVERLKEEVEKKIVSDPSKEETDIGSLVAKRQLDLIKSQVKDAVEKGATIITGGKSPENMKGAFY